MFFSSSMGATYSTLFEAQCVQRKHDGGKLKVFAVDQPGRRHNVYKRYMCVDVKKHAEFYMDYIQKQLEGASPVFDECERLPLRSLNEEYTNPVCNFFADIEGPKSLVLGKDECMNTFIHDFTRFLKDELVVLCGDERLVSVHVWTASDASKYSYHVFGGMRGRAFETVDAVQYVCARVCARIGDVDPDTVTDMSATIRTHGTVFMEPVVDTCVYSRVHRLMRIPWACKLKHDAVSNTFKYVRPFVLHSKFTNGEWFVLNSMDVMDTLRTPTSRLPTLSDLTCSLVNVLEDAPELVHPQGLSAAVVSNAVSTSNRFKHACTVGGVSVYVMPETQAPPAQEMIITLLALARSVMENTKATKVKIDTDKKECFFTSTNYKKCVIKKERTDTTDAAAGAHSSNNVKFVLRWDLENPQIYQTCWNVECMHYMKTQGLHNVWKDVTPTLFYNVDFLVNYYTLRNLLK